MRYKVEVKPGVGFLHLFPTRIEALIFIRDLSEACVVLGVVPFKCEIINVKERDDDACIKESGTTDEEDAGGAVREVSESGV